MWNKNTFSSFFLSLSKFDLIVIIIICRGDLDMFLWDCLSYLQHKCTIMLIQLLWITPLTHSCFCPPNSCSQTICLQPTITLLQKQNGRNYSAIMILHQRKTCLCLTPDDLRDETQRHVSAEVTSLWNYVTKWNKGQLHPKDQNHISN